MLEALNVGSTINLNNDKSLKQLWLYKTNCLEEFVPSHNVRPALLFGCGRFCQRALSPPRHDFVAQQKFNYLTGLLIVTYDHLASARVFAKTEPRHTTT